MGSITINSNIASLNAQRRLGQSTGSLQDSFTRLSSGLRINKAADDAAGLSIASSLDVDRRVFNQGVRNLNDGVSLLSIADSALNELSNITVRLTELAEQAANGAVSNTQRSALDEEAQALRDEYFRIAQTTQFNGRKIFDGDFGELRLQAGFGEQGGVVASLGGAIGDGTFSLTQTLANVGGADAFNMVSADFNNDGLADLVTANSGANSLSVVLGEGDGSFSDAVTVGGPFAGVTPRPLVTADFNNDGMLDLVTSNGSGVFSAILLGNGDGSFETATEFLGGNNTRGLAAGDLNGDGAVDLMTANYGGDDISILLGKGDGTFTSFGTIDAGAGSQPHSIKLADLNGDGILDGVVARSGLDSVGVALGTGDGSFGSLSVYNVGNFPESVVVEDFDNDGIFDIATANRDSNTLNILRGLGDGTFDTSALQLAGGSNPRQLISEDLNGDGNADIAVAIEGLNAVGVYLGNGNGTFQAATTTQLGVGAAPKALVAGDFDQDGVLDLAVSADGPDAIGVLVANTNSGLPPLLEFSLATMADARQALPVFKQKLNQLAAQRGQIGAFEARLNTAVATTRTASENYASAASQIVDADVAVEAAKLVRNQILQQAGAAILSQANQGPGLALALLG